MKKLIDLFKFIGILSINLILLFMFALTGSLSMLILLPFGIFCMALILNNSSL